MSYKNFGEELSGDVAMLQAGQVIDIIAKISESSKNLDGLATAAQLWIEIGKTLGSPSDDDEDKEPTDATRVVGFGIESEVENGGTS